MLASWFLDYGYSRRNSGAIIRTEDWGRRERTCAASPAEIKRATARRIWKAKKRNVCSLKIFFEKKSCEVVSTFRILRWLSVFNSFFFYIRRFSLAFHILRAVALLISVGLAAHVCSRRPQSSYTLW